VSFPCAECIKRITYWWKLPGRSNWRKSSSRLPECLRGGGCMGIRKRNVQLRQTDWVHRSNRSFHTTRLE
jgi:hypothetical protein